MALLQRLAISALSFRRVKDGTSGLAAGAPVRRPQAWHPSVTLVSIISLPVDDSLPAHEAFLSRSGSCAGLFEFAVRQGVRAEATGCVAKWLLAWQRTFFVRAAALPANRDGRSLRNCDFCDLVRSGRGEGAGQAAAAGGVGLHPAPMKRRRGHVIRGSASACPSAETHFPAVATTDWIASRDQL